MMRTVPWVLVLLLLAPIALAQTDPMQAPPDEELDRRTEEWVTQRRWMAAILIGGTLLAGGGASFLRRRRRRLEAAREAERPQWPPTAWLLSTDSGLRTDPLRKALRAGLAPPESEREPLQELFTAEPQSAVRVLVLEALQRMEGGAPLRLLERAIRDEGDSVRALALHLLVTRMPGRSVDLAREHLQDPGVEVRTYCAEILADEDPEAAGNAMLELVHAEDGGPRGPHALRRAMSVIAEDIADPAWATRVEALRDEVDDEEGMIDWALAKLGQA